MFRWLWWWWWWLFRSYKIWIVLIVFDILIFIPAKSGQLGRFSWIQRSHFLLHFKSKSSIHNEIQNRDVTFEESQIHHQQLQLPPRCSILQQQLQLQTPLEKERFKAKIRTQSVPHWMLFWKSKEDSHLRGSGQFQVVDHRSFMQEHAVLRPELYHCLKRTQKGQFIRAEQPDSAARLGQNRHLAKQSTGPVAQPWHCFKGPERLEIR